MKLVRCKWAQWGRHWYGDKTQRHVNVPLHPHSVEAAIGGVVIPPIRGIQKLPLVRVNPGGKGGDLCQGVGGEAGRQGVILAAVGIHLVCEAVQAISNATAGGSTEGQGVVSMQGSSVAILAVQG